MNSAITLKDVQFAWDDEKSHERKLLGRAFSHKRKSSQNQLEQYSATGFFHIHNLEITQGDRVLLYGPSGSGKSTLIHLLAGVTSPLEGSVKLFNTALETLNTVKRNQFRADYLGVIFQDLQLIPYLTVLQNVLLPAQVSLYRRQLVLQHAADLITAASSMLERLEIDASSFSKPTSKLSLGQQQRVAVVRALLGEPKLILADEPASALDQLAEETLIKLLIQTAAEKQSTVVYVSHDNHYAHFFNRCIHINEVMQTESLAQEL